jgi:hypothetical protein
MRAIHNNLLFFFGDKMFFKKTTGQNAAGAGTTKNEQPRHC